MAVVTVWYGFAFKGKEDGTANAGWLWLTDTIKISLHTVTYAKNVDTDDFFNDATNEVSSAGYTAGGFTLASKTVTYDTASNETRYDAADPSWTGVTFTTRQAVVYKSTGTGTTSPLIANIDFGGDQVLAGGNFSIVFDATGVIKATA